ncbi:YkvA family protein [Mesobacillus thioparans]|uniref:YkvA family protein n=1 Tax=Mesobacillus thioparans TaxID=370439 RepID=UPI0039F0A133
MRKAMERFKVRMKKIKEDIFVIAEAVKHQDTPFYIKVIALVVVAYAFSPIDLIPDFIPVLGYLDDLILVPLGIALLLKLLPNHVIQESRETVAANGKVKKKNWLAGAVILLLWAAVIYWVVGLLVQNS